MADPQPITLSGLPGAFAEGEGIRRDFPLLFLHGVMGGHRQFDAYLEFFSARGFDSYAFSRRGRQGVPPENACGLRMRDYLEDTFAVIDALDRQPVVVGNCMGSLLAQKAAEAGRCRAIVLIAPNPPRGVAVRPPTSALPVYANIMTSIVTGRPKVPSYDVAAAVVLSRLPEAERRRVYDDFVPESGLVFRDLARGIPVDVAKVRCPVLVVGGGADGFSPPRVARAIARHYQAELLEYPESDRWIIGGPGWEVAADDIAKWIEKVA